MSVHHLQLHSVSVHLILSFSTKGLLFHLILISFWEYTQPFSCASRPLYKDSVFRSISRELDQGLAVGISGHSWSQLTSFGLFLLSEGKKSFLRYLSLKQNQMIQWPSNTRTSRE